MVHPDKKYFDLLKEEVALVLRTSYTEAAERMEQWNVKTIEAFQADLQKRVRSSVSTKWFYTHIKSATGEKIPRTDVLNLLAQYAGHENWADFLAKHKPEEQKEEYVSTETGQTAQIPLAGSTETLAQEEVKTSVVHKKPARKMVLAFSLLLGIGAMLLISWIVMGNEKKAICKFCFTDANFKMPLKTKKIEIQVLDEMQSPQLFDCDSTACITLHHKPGKVRFVVKADYCIPDTLVRILEEGESSETVELRTDDYALMISIFSNSGIEDWERRKNQLERMFDDDAEIFQLSPGDLRGMEMYNKEEFINKMTMPLQSLKNIVVLNTEYRNKKIVSLKFYIEEK